MTTPPRVSLAQMARRNGAVLRRGNSAQYHVDAAPTLDDLTECLSFSPGDGRIWLNDQRMMLLHGSAFGRLRRELVEALGAERARGLLTRMGYASGARDAQLVRERWPEADAAAMFMAGTRLHALEGVVKVVPQTFAFDIDRGTYEGEFTWEHSSEDDAHIEAYGIGTEPACWTQVGYAIGYVTGLFGRLVVFREFDCRSMGAHTCRVIGRHAEAWDDVEQDLRHLRAPAVGDGLSAGRSEPFAKTGAKGARATVRKTSSQDERAGTHDRDELVGASSAFNAACHQLERVASTQATVLFTGESGVGKEAFARLLHRISARSAQPFLAVNCAAIPESLIESELFGVERGAFTGATVSRPGRFERAHRGTLFLDEIGTLSLVSQGKLLRAVQEGELERVGGTRTLHVDVRVVAATNVDLSAAVRAGRFREDLFYRLNVYPIHLPPLRERRDDIVLLMNHFAGRYARRHGRRIAGFTPRAVRALLNYAFPGNIRELQNLIERAVIAADEESAIDLPHLFRREQLDDDLLYSIAAHGGLTRGASAQVPSLMDRVSTELDGEGLSLDALERRLLDEAVERAGGNLAAAARLLGLSRAQLAYRLRRNAAGKRKVK